MRIEDIEYTCAFFLYIYLHVRYSIYEDIGFAVVEQVTNIADPRPDADPYVGAVYIDVKSKNGDIMRISLGDIVPPVLFFIRLRKKMNLEETMTILKYLNKDKFENGRILETFKEYIHANNNLQYVAPKAFSDLPKDMPDQLWVRIHDAIVAYHDLRTALLENGFTQEQLLECEIKDEYYFEILPEVSGLPVHFLKEYGIEIVPRALDMLKAVKLFRDVTVPKVCPRIIVSNDLGKTIIDDDNNDIIINHASGAKNSTVEKIDTNIDTSTLTDFIQTNINVKADGTVIKSIAEIMTNTHYILINLSLLVIYFCTIMLLYYWPIVTENKYVRSLYNYSIVVKGSYILTKINTYYFNKFLNKLNNFYSSLKIAFNPAIQYLKKKLRTTRNL